MSQGANPKIHKGLRQAQGHLESILVMVADGRSCPDLAQQLQAVESTIRTVKRALIHDHMEHCMTTAAAEGGKTVEATLRELKSLTKYL